jgi:hypothetical protein
MLSLLYLSYSPWALKNECEIINWSEKSKFSVWVILKKSYFCVHGEYRDKSIKTENIQINFGPT